MWELAMLLKDDMTKNKYCAESAVDMKYNVQQTTI